jgi:hypothetical protein
MLKWILHPSERPEPVNIGHVIHIACEPIPPGHHPSRNKLKQQRENRSRYKAPPANGRAKRLAWPSPRKAVEYYAIPKSPVANPLIEFTSDAMDPRSLAPASIT